MVAMVSMMRINAVEISKKSKCAGKTAISKSFKRLKSDVHNVGKVGNDDLNYVCNGYHDAHQRSRNSEKVEMCKPNCNFETFENTINLIYTMYAMSEMMI